MGSLPSLSKSHLWNCLSSILLLENWALLILTLGAPVIGWQGDSWWAGNHVSRCWLWATAIFKGNIFLLCFSAGKVQSKGSYKLLCRNFFCHGFCLDRHWSESSYKRIFPNLILTNHCQCLRGVSWWPWLLSKCESLSHA